MVNIMSGFFASNMNGILSCILAIATLSEAYPEGFSESTVIDKSRLGSIVPMQITFLPDNRALVVGKVGVIYIMQERQIGSGYDVEEYITLPTYVKDEVGLVSVLPEPEERWEAGHQNIYIYYSPGNVSMEIATFVHSENSGGTSSRGLVETVQTLWVDTDGFPQVSRRATGDPVLWHYGGQLDWDPEGNILLSLGDKYRSDWAQRADKHAGCIIRIARDGSVPTGNLPSWVKPAACWAYGGRNLFQGTWDTAPGGEHRYFVAEVGGNNQKTASEDLHIVDQGENLGWPYCEGHCDNPREAFSQCDCDVHDDPVYAYDHSGSPACIIGGFVYRGHAYPNAYTGAYFFADYSRWLIKYIKFTYDGSRDVESVHNFHTTDQRPLGLSQDKEGNVWFIENPISKWRIKKIMFALSGNLSPEITDINIFPQAGPAPLTVNFNATAIDVNEDVIHYSWLIHSAPAVPIPLQEEIEGDNVQFTFRFRGTYGVQLVVSDHQTSHASQTFTIHVGSPPALTLDTQQSTFVAGEIIELFGTAMDSDGGDLSESLEWNIAFIHNEHFHPFGSASTGSKVIAAIPTTGHSFQEDTGLRFTATSTDSNGISGIAEVTMRPRKQTIVFTSSPIDVRVQFHEGTIPTPLSFPELIGFQVEAGVPQDACFNRSSYRFDRWEAAADTIDEPLSTHMTIRVTEMINTANAIYNVVQHGGASLDELDCQAIYRINAGGDSFVDNLGYEWESDETYATDGFRHTPQFYVNSKPGELDKRYEDMLLSERTTSGTSMNFHIPIIAPGFYQVRLLFKEQKYNTIGSRIFNVFIQNELRIHNFDIYADAGFSKVTSKSFDIQTSTSISISLVNVMRSPIINGIIVTARPTGWEPPPSTSTAVPSALALPTSIRINAGGKNLVDHLGYQWVDGSAYAISASQGNPPKGYIAPDPGPLDLQFSDIITKHWWGKKGVSVKVLVAPGTYFVDLIFAEQWHAAGIRVFDIALQGTVVQTGFDPAAESGGLGLVVVRTFVVDAPSGRIDIDLYKVSKEPMINGIVIINSDGITTSTIITPTVGATASTGLPETATSSSTSSETNLAVSMTAPAGVPAADSTSVHINSGGNSFFDHLGYNWIEGWDFVAKNAKAGHYPKGFVAPQPGPLELRYGNIMNTHWWSKKTMLISVPVQSAGKYVVTLVFAEQWHNAGKRVFDIVLQGMVVQAHFDPVAESDGLGYVTVRTFVVDAPASIIFIELRKVKREPMINGIVVFSADGVDASTIASSIGTYALTGDTSPGAEAVPSTVDDTSPGAETVPSMIRINGGGGALVDHSDNQWIDGWDMTFNAKVGNPPKKYIAPPGGPLELQYREILIKHWWSKVTLSVHVPVVVPGTYSVDMIFAEQWFATAGTRVFDIALQGTVVQAGFDPVAESGGLGLVVVRTFVVEAPSGRIDIDLYPILKEPMINGIVISTFNGDTLSTISSDVGSTGSTVTEAAVEIAPTVLHINSGGSALTDHLGIQWIDGLNLAKKARPGKPPKTYVAPKPGPLELQYSDILDKHWWSKKKISVHVPVAVPGTYSVDMIFAEQWFATAGTRVFDIALQGSVVQAGFDPVAESGGLGLVVVRTFVVEAPSGQIHIDLHQILKEPMINGIVIQPQ